MPPRAGPDRRRNSVAARNVVFLSRYYCLLSVSNTALRVDVQGKPHSQDVYSTERVISRAQFLYSCCLRKGMCRSRRSRYQGCQARWGQVASQLVSWYPAITLSSQSMGFALPICLNRGWNASHVVSIFTKIVQCPRLVRLHAFCYC